MAADIHEMSTIAENVEGAESTQNQNSLENSFIYRAKCVDNKDPLKTGRIKVWIPETNFTKSEDNDGIWCYPCSPYAGANLEEQGKPVSDFGSLYVPPKDSFVYIFFENGDQNKPRYFGSMITEGAVPTENQAGKEWWNKHTVIKTPKKRIIMVSDDESTGDACVIIRGKERK